MLVFNGYGNRFETSFCRKYVEENPAKSKDNKIYITLEIPHHNLPKQKVASPVNRDRVMHSRYGAKPGCFSRCCSFRRRMSFIAFASGDRVVVM